MQGPSPDMTWQMSNTNPHRPDISRVSLTSAPWGLGTAAYQRAGAVFCWNLLDFELLFTSSPAPGTLCCVTRSLQLQLQRGGRVSAVWAPTIPYLSGGCQHRRTHPCVGPSSVGALAVWERGGLVGDTDRDLFWGCSASVLCVLGTWFCPQVTHRFLAQRCSCPGT